MDARGKLLILTVGSGVGPASTIAEGLIAAITQSKCSSFILIPSSSMDSKAVAALVAESVPGHIETPFVITDPDDIHVCLNTVNDAITYALKSNHMHICINPTSGTKQMTAGAIVAGMQGNVKELEFIKGVRKDGTIQVNTEELARFGFDSIAESRDRKLACHLFNVGDFVGARYIILNNELLHYLLPLVDCTVAWECEDYQKAYTIAKSSSLLASCIPSLMALKNKKGLDMDVLFTAHQFMARGHYQSALRRYIKGVELFLKDYLLTRYGFPSPCPMNLLIDFPSIQSKDGKPLVWNFVDISKLFSVAGDTLYLNFTEGLHRYTRLRNLLTHESSPADLNIEVPNLAKHINSFICTITSNRPKLA